MFRPGSCDKYLKDFPLILLSFHPVLDVPDNHQGVTIEDEDRNLLIVIHAMKRRKQYLYLLEGDYNGL